MGFFSSGKLDYSIGDGFLPKCKRSRYFAHLLPGEVGLVQIDTELMQAEAVNGKYQALMMKALDFAVAMEPLSVSYEYEEIKPDPLSSPNAYIPGQSSEETMSLLANQVNKHIDSARDIHWELLPFLRELEERLDLKMSHGQRRSILFFFRFGMALSLIENLSGLNIVGYSHPSVSNQLIHASEVLRKVDSMDYEVDLDFLPDSKTKNEYVKLFMYIGYFQSKYNGELPSFVLQKVEALPQ